MGKLAEWFRKEEEQQKEDMLRWEQESIARQRDEELLRAANQRAREKGIPVPRERSSISRASEDVGGCLVGILMLGGTIAVVATLGMAAWRFAKWTWGW